MSTSRGPRIYMWADEEYKAKFEKWVINVLKMRDNGKALRFLADQAMAGERNVTAEEQEFLDEMLELKRRIKPETIEAALRIFRDLSKR